MEAGINEITWGKKMIIHPVNEVHKSAPIFIATPCNNLGGGNDPNPEEFPTKQFLFFLPSWHGMVI